MPSPANLGFETPGASSGQANSWIERFNLSHYLVAGGHIAAGYAPSNELVPITFPTDFSDGVWVKTNLTVTANDATAPDGTNTADRLTDDATNGYHRAYHNVSKDIKTGRRYCVGCYLKAGTLASGGIRVDAGTWDGWVLANLTTGEIEWVSAPTGRVSKVNGRIINLPSGWHWVGMFFEVSGSGVLVVPQVVLSSNAIDGTILYAGAGQTIYAWGFTFFEGDLADTEKFEGGWLNDAYLLSLTLGTSSELAFYATPFVTSDTFDSFETQWLNTGYLLVLANVESALYDVTPEAREDFEEDWSNNGYLLVLSGPTAAVYDGENFEDLEENWGGGRLITLTFTADAGTDVISAAGHGLLNGQSFVVSNSGGALPAPLIADQEYFAIYLTVNTFQVSLTQGGAAINITSAGTGTHSFSRRIPDFSIPFTADHPTNTFTSTNHGLLNGQAVQLESTNGLPSPLVRNSSYFVIGATTNTFQLSLTKGGAAIDISDNGTGEQGVLRHVTEYDSSSGGSFELPEDFEEVRIERQYTVDPGTDTFTSVAHGYSTNDVVFFKNQGGTGQGIPLGLNKTQPYFIIGAAADTFQVSLTQGGGAVNVTDAGSGINTFVGDPGRYWTEINVTV